MVKADLIFQHTNMYVKVKGRAIVDTRIILSQNEVPLLRSGLTINSSSPLYNSSLACIGQYYPVTILTCMRWDDSSESKFPIEQIEEILYFNFNFLNDLNIAKVSYISQMSIIQTILPFSWRFCAYSNCWGFLLSI